MLARKAVRCLRGAVAAVVVRRRRSLQLAVACSLLSSLVMAVCFLFRLYVTMREHSARTCVTLRELCVLSTTDAESIGAAVDPATILQANADFMAHSSYLKAEVTSLVLIQLSHAILAVRLIDFFAGSGGVPQCFVMAELLVIFGLMALWFGLYMQFACLVMRGDSSWRSYAVLESTTHLALQLFRWMDRWPLLKIEHMLAISTFGTPATMACLTCVALLFRGGGRRRASAAHSCKR
ncbi:AaceriAFL233Cp [[Ashbya] aceris (nom. inval.)]|nr:AaceriAFL233Cp [[Ashbya] aceris (nom. inval.)]